MTRAQKSLINLAIVFGGYLLVTLMLQVMDLRFLNGINVWVKPAKFALSFMVLAATQAAYLHFVRPERQSRWHIAFVFWGLFLPAIFELGYMSFQASQGLPSHFFRADAFHSTMYALMGVGAVSLILTLAPPAYEIARHPVPGLSGDLRFTLVAAPILSIVLVLITAGYMSSLDGHSVGVEAGHFPVFGWNRAGGDLRVPHFFALHAHQVLPLGALIVRSMSRPARWLVIVAGTVGYTAFCVWTFTEALAAHPFLPGVA